MNEFCRDSSRIYSLIRYIIYLVHFFFIPFNKSIEENMKRSLLMFSFWERKFDTEVILFTGNDQNKRRIRMMFPNHRRSRRQIVLHDQLLSFWWKDEKDWSFPLEIDLTNIEERFSMTGVERKEILWTYNKQNNSKEKIDQSEVEERSKWSTMSKTFLSKWSLIDMQGPRNTITIELFVVKGYQIKIWCLNKARVSFFSHFHTIRIHPKFMYRSLIWALMPKREIWLREDDH